MLRPPPRRRRKVLAGLAPVALAVAALPLLAPTCGDSGEGFKTFARNSLIIPMDVCYQYQTDGMRASYTPASCPQAADPGDVVKAYGLVYQLIRNDIAVYWIIDNQKTAVDGIDLSLQYDGGFPALYYDWSPEDPPPASPPTAQHVIDYRGGPFVVDGSDFARASQVLQSFRATFQNVNVHVANVAFRAYAKRTMAGGWNAGGAVAPKVALLDIGSTSNPTSSSSGYAKNSEPIIRGYLARAGLDFAGAGGVATDNGHGEIYDRLGIADLQPATPGGSWTTSNLSKYGYQILWVPHWFAPGSCSNATSQSACYASLYPAQQRDTAVATVGAFVAAGKDLFAECAGLGSFEGVPSAFASFEDGDPSTHLHATAGLVINRAVGTAVYDAASASSPLLQLGDYPFLPRTGAIQNYKPETGSTYQPSVVRLVTDQTDPTWNYFTLLPKAAPHGTVVYLGGHVYSGYSDTLAANGALQPDFASFQIGGTRLVLNTLFNLGATCTASGVACNTGALGICAPGRLACDANGQPVCEPLPTSTPTAEICNGLDDNCNGEVDEGLTEGCYDGPAGTRDVGLCRGGVRSCAKNADGSYGMSACTGQVLPGVEVCNALDDDCDGQVDEGLTQSCYEGPASSIDPITGQPRPACQAGTRTCALGSWGACVGQVLPRPERCDEGGVAIDDDCDGTVNNGCICLDGQQRACYTGPAGTAGVGICRAGLQTCSGGAWGPCAGEVLPAPEDCATPADENCDTLTPPCPECLPGQTRPCYPGDPGDVLVAPAQCRSGTQGCDGDHWGECLGATLPAAIEICDAVDNDCDGLVDEGAICPSNFVCEHGVCVPDACGVEIPPPEGYVCDPDGDANGVVLLGTCGDVGVCPDGAVCRFGQCAAPCTPGQCAAGSVCGGGACVAGGCYATGCPDGELCRNGACVPDPCLGALCPSGTFCRNGDCVQACAFVSCFTGEKCGVDGFCAPDPCAGRTCGPGERCAAGACVANPCANKGCAQGQVCTVAGDGSAVCVDDPCAGIRCPAGVCAGGQCYATSNPTGAGTIAPGGGGGGEGGCGCGSGSGAGAALPALLGLLLAPLARRRRRPGSGLVLLLVGVALLAGGCKEETPFDPATCQETCGEQRCVDLESDPVYCGGCGAGFACAGGQICVDAVCGPAGAVAPYVKTLSPAAGPVGALVPVTVQLTGERFAAGATVRVVSPAGSRTYAATVPDAEHLFVDLDLSGVGPTTWQLRVVNPDKVISNAVTFDVVVPFPAVTAVDPAIVTAGSSTSVLLTGTGFNLTSQCHLRSLLVPEFALPSTVDAAGVHCTVSAETLAPGEYEIWVVNEGNLASNVKQLDIVSQTPTLTGVSPSSGPENATVSLTVSGTGFDPSSRVLFDGCASPADAGCPVDATIVGTSFLTPTTLQAALTLPGCAVTPCSHSISVRNGAGAPTATVPFVVQADTATIATFSTSPAPPYQGDASVTLTFTGTNLSGTIEVQPPAGSFGDVPLTPGAAGPTTVSGTIGLVGRPEGGWLARIAYGGGATSAAWPFRVLSNQAILQDFAASPDPARSGAQGTTKSSVSFQVANVRPLYAGVKVWFRGPAGYAVELDPSPDPTGATGPVTVPNLSLGDLETGTYAFTVKNPNGAAESNALSFSVTPGLPTLSSVSPSSYPLSSPNPVVAVTLTGTNFAKPDANGNGGSVVHILAPALGIPDYAIPAAATTVASRTQIQVQLDVRNGLPGAYDVQIWNPSLPTTVPPAPQKSNTLAGGFTIAP